MKCAHCGRVAPSDLLPEIPADVSDRELLCPACAATFLASLLLNNGAPCPCAVCAINAPGSHGPTAFGVPS